MVALLLCVSTSLSQNLVPNPSFETYTDCPTSLNGNDPLPATPWVQGNAASADYFNTCASPGNAGVPQNLFGYQFPMPVTGQAYAGLFAHSYQSNYREYIQAPLNTALSAGAAYLVSFYISLADTRCAIKPFGALFTIVPPTYDSTYVLDDYSPQVEVNGEYLNDYSNWTLISRCFIAEGGEQYITIGNFRDDDESPIDPNCEGSFTTHSYYYIDSVSVVEMPLSEDYFVLDPVVACPPYTIFPGNAENYLWSDGTTNPTLTVTESGTYNVTLSDECAFQYGEAEVTILPDNPPVALPSDTALCIGETLEISLDPDMGDYVWQDASTSSDYIISSDGEYSVTLTDDCDMTSDTINVAYVYPPDFSLGTDTLICNGDAITYAFDPLMGQFTWQDGSHVSTYTVDGNGTYALTITNMCGQVSDSIQVEFIDSLVFSIGPDQTTLCDGDFIEIDLDPSLGDFHWQDGTTESTYTISGSGVYAVTVTNACYAASDSMLVSVIYPPEFTLGPDVTVCPESFP